VKTSIRFAGLGGQGVILAGIILAKAAALYEEREVTVREKHAHERERDQPIEGGRYAVQLQSYGPEARGGASKSDVIISDERINYPYVESSNILVVMSEAAYQKYIERVVEDGVIILDPDMVRSRPKRKHHQVPATRTALQLGNRIVANVIMLGALCRITSIVSRDALEKAILDLVPDGTKELNLKAFEIGYSLPEEENISSTYD